MRRGLALAALAIALVLSWTLLRPATVAGHASLVRAEPSENSFLPRNPPEVALTFSETVDLRASFIRVLDAAGRPIATGPLELSPSGLTLRVALDPLPPGIYNVIWSNVSTVDGHRLQGSYPFTILNADGSLPDVVNEVGGIGTDPDPPPSADGIAVRGLAYLGLGLAGGAALVSLLLPAGLAGTRRGLAVATAAGALVLLASTLLQLELIRDTYPGRGLTEVLGETRIGSYWLVRLGAALVAILGATALLESPRVAAVTVLAATAAAMYAFAATSHAAAGTGAGWAIAIDLLHGLAAVGWLGGVTGLAVTARLAGRSRAYAPLMPRFALAASLMVFVLLATGVLSTLIQLDTAERLWTTRYGLALVTKVGLVGLLLGVAFYNARWGRRRLVAQRPGEPARFLRTATAEIGLGVLVFAAAATLTHTTAAKSVFERGDSGPYDQTVPAGDLAVRLQVTPNRTGLNSYTVEVEDGITGERVTADRVRLTFRYLEDPNVGPSNLSLARTPDGSFSGQGPFLTLEGDWRVEVDIRRPDVDDVRAFFDVRPAGTAIGIVRAGTAWDNPAPSLTWNEFGGIALLMAAFGMALFKGRLPRTKVAPGWTANGATLAVFGLGAILLFGVHSHTTEAIPRNPITPDQNSIARGRELYQNNCMACHGRNGVPPPGLDLNPYPLDLTVHVPQHPDGILFRFISDGIPGTAMRAWGKGPDALSETDIWHVVNYLRTLGAVDR
jgi:copper transport protein